MTQRTHMFMQPNPQPFRKGETLISIPYELALDVTPSAPGGMTSKLVRACACVRVFGLGRLIE